MEKFHSYFYCIGITQQMQSLTITFIKINRILCLTFTFKNCIALDLYRSSDFQKHYL